jgi:hypothetical protein
MTKPQPQWSTQDTRFLPRFGHTTKVSYSSLRCPQRAGSFSTPFLNADHTGQGNPLILPTKSWWYKRTWVIHKLRDSQDKITSAQGTSLFQLFPSLKKVAKIDWVFFSFPGDTKSRKDNHTLRCLLLALQVKEWGWEWERNSRTRAQDLGTLKSIRH